MSIRWFEFCSNSKNPILQQQEFTKKVWITTAIVALVVLSLLLIKATFSVLLLVLAGALVAVYFWGFAGLIKRKLRWNEPLCVLMSVLATLIFFVSLFWLIGAKVEAQVQQLTDALPQIVNNAKNQLSHTAIGRRAIEKISSTKSQEQLETVAQKFFKSTFGVLGDVYVVLFLGIFFTVSPRLYTTGVVALVPSSGKDKARQVLALIAINLKKWLKGKMFSMLVVFVLTTIGLLVIGVPMWLALALIAGVLNFIPNFGPLIALIPAVLVGLMHGPTTAAWVGGLYIFIQVVESNFITPFVQKKLVNIPPAMILIAQLLVAPLSGGWGLIVATPLLLITMTLVQQLYTKRN
jgi:predicted PurR-regulated permease PerM